MTRITSDPDAYRALFKVEGRADAAVLSDALTGALDIRKFEIDVYWRRAAYFWTLIEARTRSYRPAAP